MRGVQILRTVEIPNPAAQLPSLDPPFVLHSELWIIMMIVKLTNELMNEPCQTVMNLRAQPCQTGAVSCGRCAGCATKVGELDDGEQGKHAWKI